MGIALSRYMDCDSSEGQLLRFIVESLELAEYIYCAESPDLSWSPWSVIDIRRELEQFRNDVELYVLGCTSPRLRLIADNVLSISCSGQPCDEDAQASPQTLRALSNATVLATTHTACCSSRGKQLHAGCATAATPEGEELVSALLSACVPRAVAPSRPTLSQNDRAAGSSDDVR